jgi:3-isopropylmalate dehydrogenase
LLRYSLGKVKEGQAIEDAVRKVLDAKDIGGMEVRTKDLKGNATSKEVGDKVLQVLETLL